MSAKDVRWLYIETIAQARYAREAEGVPWSESIRNGTYLEQAAKDVDALGEAGLLPLNARNNVDIAAELSRTAGILAWMAEEVRRDRVKQVEERDRHHNEIEAAHRRWWHPLLGIRWEMTGWSRKGSGWQL